MGSSEPKGASPFHLLHVVPSGEWGGPERYAFDICRYFDARGWKVKTLTRDARAVDCQFLKAGMEVCHAPLRRYPDYYSARAMARLFADMPRGRGIVHVHRLNDALTCIIARKIARRSDIRLIVTRHKADRGMDSFLRRIIYRGIDSHLFVSEFSKKRFYERWSGRKAPLDPEKTAVTYNSLLYVASEPLPEPEKGPIVAAYRGGLKTGKGLETLIDALALLKHTKIRLQIMGKGNPDYVDSLRRKAQMAGVADRIVWVRNTEFTEEKMALVHFGVLPSEEPEAFGMANLEFMAWGKPQISTFTGAQSEMLVPGEDSLEVPPSDAEALAKAMLTLAGDSALRAGMGRKAFDRFTRLFSWPRFIRRLAPIYLKTQY